MTWWETVTAKLAPGYTLSTPGKGIPAVGQKEFKIIGKTGAELSISSGKSKISLEKICFDVIEKAFHENPYLWLRVASLHDSEPLENSTDQLIRQSTGSKLARGNYICSILEYCGLTRYSMHGNQKGIRLAKQVTGARPKAEAPQEPLKPSSKDLHIPGYREMLDACAKFVEREKRDPMYKVAAFIVSEFWDAPRDITDGLGVLLLTWNQALYRYGRFDFDKLELAITKWKNELDAFRHRSIDSFKAGDETIISKLFNDLLDALQVAEGGNKGTKSPVAVAKALHVLAPDFFPLWDNDIAKAYGCYWPGSNQAAAYYIRFMRVTCGVLEHIIDSYVDEYGCARKKAVEDICKRGSAPFKKTILKLLDEYSYATYSKRWFR